MGSAAPVIITVVAVAASVVAGPEMGAAILGYADAIEAVAAGYSVSTLSAVSAASIGAASGAIQEAQKTGDPEKIIKAAGIGAAAAHLLAERGAHVIVSDVVKTNGQAVAEMGSLCNFLVKTKHRLLTGGQMGTLWDAENGEEIHSHYSPLNCGVLLQSDTYNYVAIGTYTGEVLVFEESETGSFALVKQIKIYENAVKGLSFCNGILFSVCANTDISWHRVSDWVLVKEIDHAHDKITNDCCAIDDSHFATVSRDRTLRIWADQKTEIYPSPHPHSVKCISISEDGQHLLTGCYGGTLALFDLLHRRWSKVERPTMSGISSIIWDDSNDQFLAASYDGSIYPMGVHA